MFLSHTFLNITKGNVWYAVFTFSINNSENYFYGWVTRDFALWMCVGVDIYVGKNICVGMDIFAYLPFSVSSPRLLILLLQRNCITAKGINVFPSTGENGIYPSVFSIAHFWWLICLHWHMYSLERYLIAVHKVTDVPRTNSHGLDSFWITFLLRCFTLWN